MKNLNDFERGQLNSLTALLNQVEKRPYILDLIYKVVALEVAAFAADKVANATNERDRDYNRGVRCGALEFHFSF